MFVSFLQIAAVHEIIETFKAPRGSEMAYAYLMCWGLFLGQALEGESRKSAQLRAMS